MTTTNIPYSPKNHNLNFQNAMNVSSISSIPGVDRSIFPMIQGHRGAPLVEPENTIAAFQHAAHSGANSVELDVFLSKDNELVVFHGGRSAKNPKEVGNLGAHTTSDDNIQNLTLDEIRRLEFVNDTFACPNEKMNGFYKVRIGNSSTALTKGFRAAAVWGVYSKSGKSYDYDSFSFV